MTAFLMDKLIFDGFLWENKNPKDWVVEHQGNQWTIVPKLIKNEDGEYYLTADVNCIYDNNSSKFLWACNSDIELKVKRIGRDGTYSIEKSKKLSFCFNRFSSNLNFGKVWWVEDRLQKEFEEDLIRKEDSIDWEFEIMVRVRVASMVESDYFSMPKNIDSEVVLRVGEHTLYVDKLALICFSKYFRGLLSAHKGDKIDVKDENNEYYCIGIVIDFLQLLYKQTTKVRNDNVESLLKLATRYDVKFLIADCDEFLSN